MPRHAPTSLTSTDRLVGNRLNDLVWSDPGNRTRILHLLGLDNNELDALIKGAVRLRAQQIFSLMNEFSVGAGYFYHRSRF